MCKKLLHTAVAIIHAARTNFRPTKHTDTDTDTAASSPTSTYHNNR